MQEKYLERERERKAGLLFTHIVHRLFAEGILDRRQTMERILVSHPLAGTVATLSPGTTRPLSPVRFLDCCQAGWNPNNGAEKIGSGPFFPFEAPKLGRSSVNATGKSWDSTHSYPSSSPGNPWELNGNEEVKALVHVQKEEDSLTADSKTSFQTLSKDMAMGLVLRAASGTGWTTDSGLEGPSNPFELKEGQGINEVSEHRWPMLSKSPRRRMRVAFTCNVCGERTTRAINPHAYTDGTVFVQCAGCNVFHKLVDNLKLFHELKGSVFPSKPVTYGHPSFAEHRPYDFLGLDDLSAS